MDHICAIEIDSEVHNNCEQNIADRLQTSYGGWKENVGQDCHLLLADYDDR